MINWLYTSTLDLSILIGVVLLIRTPIRRLFGAHIAYLLWAIPFLSVLIPLRLERPAFPVEPGVPGIDVSLLSTGGPAGAEVYYLPGGLPVAEIWLSGLALCFSVQCLLQWRLHRTLKQGSQEIRFSDIRIQQLIAGSRLDKTQIRTSAIVENPCICGLVKPVIYLPENFATAYTNEEQFWVLKHELTHFRRGDLWFQSLGELLRALYWFNPVVHIALRSFREDQEMACDQSTLRGCDDNDRYLYGKVLLRSAVPALVPSVLTFFTTTKERFNMLNNHRYSRLNTTTGLMLCAVLGTFALTTAPKSIAQSELRPQFDEVYDANLPRRFTGEIVRVDYGENFTLLHVNAATDSRTVQWIVESGSWRVMHDAGLDSNALYPGRLVTVTGYQSKDQACDPKCRLNGRDLTFAD
ncbi:MAG: DUF6152 family protein [Pseudohongiellaceae bacterium]